MVTGEQIQTWRRANRHYGWIHLVKSSRAGPAGSDIWKDRETASQLMRNGIAEPCDKIQQPLTATPPVHREEDAKLTDGLQQQAPTEPPGCQVTHEIDDGRGALMLERELPHTAYLIHDAPEKHRGTTVEQDRPKDHNSVLGDRKASRRDYHFDTPLGTGWRDLRIRFLDGHTVTISVNSRRERWTFAEMNMKDARNGNPNKQWKLLEQLADNDGRLSWTSPAAHPKWKKQVQLLAHRLQEFFGLPDSPFYSYKKGKGWELKLRIERPC